MTASPSTSSWGLRKPADKLLCTTIMIACRSIEGLAPGATATRSPICPDVFKNAALGKAPADLDAAPFWEVGAGCRSVAPTHR
jgi:hypothetical protein